MQKNLEILNSNAPIKQKSKAVNELTQFKTDIEDLVSKPIVNQSSDINDKNVKAVLNEIQQKLKSYEITCIEDVQQLYVLKQRLMKCNEIIKSVKPNVTVNDETSFVRSHFLMRVIHITFIIYRSGYYCKSTLN